MRVQAALLLLLSAAVAVHCYSTGAPAQACTDIYPEGHVGPSLDCSTSPFQLSVSDFDETYGGELYYVPRENYTLTLNGSGGEDFRGFLVQARTVADGSPVGVFQSVGTDQKLSACTPAASGVTHTNNNLKTSVQFTWIAPPHGTGSIMFLFAVVVQNSGGVSTFYATCETDVIHRINRMPKVKKHVQVWEHTQSRDNDMSRRVGTGCKSDILKQCRDDVMLSLLHFIILCACGLPLFEVFGQCVETCPPMYIGNGDEVALNGTCEPVPASYIAVLNATVYYAEISTETPANTPVYRIQLRLHENESPLDVSLRFNQNQRIQDLFEFEGGENNGIDISFPSDFTFISNEYVFDTSINFLATQSVLDDIDPNDYPVEVDITITLSILQSDLTPYGTTSQAVGSIFFDSCTSSPCQNEAACNSVNSTHFTCVCHPGFTGVTCEQVFDSCLAYEPCDNQGTCETISSNAYTCECQPGFTGENCTDISDPCLVYQPCDNGECFRVNSMEYMCNCSIGYTGQNCTENIDDCTEGVCNNGTCIDGIGTFECECNQGYTGTLCNTEIDECETANCNEGTCTDLINDFLCNCFPDYTGSDCSQTIDDCASSPCSALGSFSCEDGNLTFTCICATGFTGPTCSEEIFGCVPDPCENGATCMNGTSGTFTCICPPEFTGPTCTLDALPCDPNPCANGGNCTEAGLDYTCDCAPGWTGANCTEDVDECSSNPCENGGTCTNLQNAFECACPSGFSGLNCSEDLPFCTETRCLNGGTCVEGVGLETSCECVLGFMGDSCTEDDPGQVFCQLEICQNGGTCSEGFGPAISCTCTAGYTGDSCNEDDGEIFCAEETCFNGGTCLEEFGPATSCACASGFTGEMCSEDNPSDLFCIENSCANGGTCDEGFGPTINCTCVSGYTGDNCTMNDPSILFCNENSCANGGTCMEAFGDSVMCSCSLGFSGANCTTDIMDLNAGESLSPLALTIFSYIGAILSIVFLLIIVLMYLISRSLRKNEHGKLLINMSTSLIILYMIFIAAGLVTSVDVLCGLVSALFQYFMLVFFGWTAAEAVHLYYKLAHALGKPIEYYVLKAALIVWLVPILIVIISVGRDYNYYINSYYCRATDWPFWFGLILPVCLIYIFNWVIFTIIMIKLLRRNKATKVEASSKLNSRVLKQNVIIAAGLSLLFGLGWGLGLTATSSNAKEVTFAFQVIFSLFVGSQGVLIFLFHGICSPDFRQVWLQTFCHKKQKKYAFSSSQYSRKQNRNSSTYQMTTITGTGTSPKRSTHRSPSASEKHPSSPAESSSGLSAVEAEAEANLVQGATVISNPTSEVSTTKDEQVAKSETTEIPPEEVNDITSNPNGDSNEYKLKEKDTKE